MADESSNDLEAILPARFRENLSEAEKRLLRAAPKGEVAMGGPTFEDKDNDPAKAGGWGREREIRADVIRWLCVNQEAAKRIDPRGVQVYGAKVTGDLDLSFVTVMFPLRLSRCRLTHDCDIQYVKVPALYLDGTLTKSLNAEHADVRGSIFLSNSFSAQGKVRLARTQIGGDLDCEGGTFKNPGDTALDADGAEVKGSIFLSGGFSAQGKVRLARTQIGGDLACGGGTFKNPGDTALDADGAEVKGYVFLTGCSVEGEADLAGARIGGQLDCDRGTFKNAPGRALNADGAEISSYVFLRDARVEGEVNLLRAHIGNNLECDRGSFKNPGSTALYADGLEIKGSIFLRDGFSAEGEVNLTGARIGGQLDCDRGSFKSPGGTALYADSSEIKESALLRNGFSAEGEVNLSWAQIGGVLQSSAWKDAQRASLDLRRATVGDIWDDEVSWPNTGNLYLDGFVYGSISGGPRDAPTRLKWLERESEFTAQPYRQLAKVLRELGDDEGTKQVLFELESRARADTRRRLISAPRRWFHVAEDTLSEKTVGYGIYPARAIWELLVLAGLGWIVHRRAQRVGAMAPVDKDVYKEFHENNGTAPASYPPFNPLIYCVENCLPLVKFGQDDRWQPDPNPQTHAPAPGNQTTFLRRVATARDRFLDALVRNCATSPVVLRWFRWIMIALGWLLATFFVAGITGIIKTG